MIFNLALLPVARSLKQIKHLRIGIYADDITLRVSGGNYRCIESTHQTGTDAVSCQALLAGLSCSPTYY